ncbi:hypothetical protein B0H14DRAFT_2671123 [Mycena olivaceomarginata]|nr:hypothetical protein B0H14DRAFT_2671123 [Mycena olivaceomarginata]
MAILSPRSKSPRAGAGRTRKPSAAQKKTNENRADDAAKTRENKEKTQRAFARKAQRSNNDARAAALQDATNAAGAGESLSTEARIAALTDRLKSVTAQNKTLTLKNKKLKKLARPQAASTDKEIISILKPKGKFNLQEAMQLSDNRQLFTELQAGVHSIALEAKIDFDSSWSQQDPGTVAKVLRVAGERHPHLNAKRYPKNWATASMLQTYINSVRAYRSGKANPLSGVSRRRQRLTRVGRREAEATPRRRSSRQSPPPAGSECKLLFSSPELLKCSQWTSTVLTMEMMSIYMGKTVRLFSI